MTATPSPTQVRTIYTPFLEKAIALLEAHLDIRPYPIPEGFERKSAVTGKGKRQAP